MVVACVVGVPGVGGVYAPVWRVDAQVGFELVCRDGILFSLDRETEQRIGESECQGFHV